MFDTMTWTKIGGAACGALLVFLLAAWLAEILYHTGGGHGDHGSEQAYVIETGEEDAGEDAAVEVDDIMEMMASAEVEAGASVYKKKCKSCHSVEDGANGVGPSLYGVVGRAVGAVDGYSYSGSLVAVAETWSVENLSGFLTNPKSYAPGTKMNFKGLGKTKDRANLITYLDSLDN